MRTTDQPSRVRHGFTLLELLVVLVLAGIAGTIVVPSITRSMAETRVQRAAAVIASDLQLAHTMAGRQRSPVVVDISTGRLTLTVRDFVNAGTIYSRRHFGTTTATDQYGHAVRQGEYPVEYFTTSAASVTIYPNGIASSELTLRLGAGSSERQVKMTRAGQVRVTKP